jgi:hypothetical protein
MERFWSVVVIVAFDIRLLVSGFIFDLHRTGRSKTLSTKQETAANPGRGWRREGRMAGWSPSDSRQVAASAFCRVWLTKVSVASSRTRPRRLCGGWM